MLSLRNFGQDTAILGIQMGNRFQLSPFLIQRHQKGGLGKRGWIGKLIIQRIIFIGCGFPTGE